MTTLEAINKIKQMFAEAGELPVASSVPTQSFAEYVLKSGAKVMIDKYEIGGKVSLVDESGNEVPAPAGEHELADGSVMVLDEASTIIEIKIPEVEMPEEVEIEVAPIEEDLMKKKIEEMQKQLDEIKMAYDAKLASQEAKFSKGMSDISDVLVQLLNTPSANATEAPKEKFNQHIEKKEDKISRFLEFAKSIK
jgi:molecular chaperone DnaK (HSP70)